MPNTSAPSSPHKRSQTYEGEQMTFRFPSEEDLTNTGKDMELTGPPIQPYYIYEKSISASNHQSPTQSPNIGNLHKTFDYNEDGFLGLQDSPQALYPQSYFSYNDHGTETSLISGHYTQLTVGSLPTEDNVSYQITSLSNHSDQHSFTAESVEENKGHNHVDSRTTTRHHPVVSRKSSLFRRNTARKRTNISRHPTVSSDADVSLFRESSLKRSKAIKSKVGWISKLKLIASKLKRKIKNWRFIARRKSLKFKSFQKSNASLTNNRISMPLERETVQSISELKKTWYTVNERKVITVDAPPSARYQLIDTPRTTEANQSPPKAPQHTFVSMQAIPRALSTRRERNSLFSTYNSAAQLEVLSISDQNSVTYLRGRPDSIVEEDEEEKFGEDIENSDNEVHYQSEYNEEEEEELVKNYWRSYLRKVVADRIESKLGLKNLKDNSSNNNTLEDANEMFSLISDTDTLSSNDSEFSFCISAYSDNISDDSYLVSESHNDDGFISYENGPVPVPHEILKYEQQFIERYKHQNNGEIKRSLTDAKGRSNISVPITSKTHTRFLSSLA